ncbi:uncharacterized protein LOC106642467 [Copidosoma floridanum]|uniref:uncharacterized protein LOC106642467 n=1 Tax=Copidosoma floridanum TaxID=29053 RepID=UPI0006C9BE99|nr:uncharacterized protein LOC106642467 [Copidosoma floridanum]
MKNWRIFYANDFLSIMQPSILVCRLYGLIPYTVVNFRIRKSRAAFIHCTIVTFIYICISLVILYFINASIYSNRICTRMLQDNCFYILVNFMLICNYTFGTSVMKIVNYLATTTTKLPCEKFTKISKWIHTKDFIVYTLLIVHVPKILSGDVPQIIRKLVGFYSTTAIYMLDLQYNNFVYILGICFEHINEELIKLKNNLKTDQAHLLRRVYHNRMNPVLFLTLRYLKQWHYELNEIVRKVNSTFSLQIIASVIITFTELTFGLYFYILDKRHKKMNNLEMENWFFYYYTVVIYFSSKLLLLTLTCHNANNENSKTRKIINEILINTDDKLFKEEVHMYSLQLLHTNIYIAKGIRMDASLLTTMSKGIFTYLLILIQFLVTSE